MADLYRAFGTEMSVHLIEVRGHLHDKAIQHQWLLREAGSERDAGYAATPKGAVPARVPEAMGCLAGLPA